MKFESLDETFSFYIEYARESGFSARMSNSKKSKKTNEVIWKKLVCFKEGQTNDSWSKQVNSDQQRKERARGDVRTGCKSRIPLAFALVVSFDEVAACLSMKESKAFNASSLLENDLWDAPLYLFTCFCASSQVSYIPGLRPMKTTYVFPYITRKI